jgi:copper resistance protein C
LPRLVESRQWITYPSALNFPHERRAFTLKPAQARAWTLARASLRLVIGSYLITGLSDAQAHAIVLESSPSVNASVAGTDLRFNLRFNSRIDKQRSRLRIVGPEATVVPLSVDEDPAANRLVSRAPKLSPGAYRLEWQVLGADGHITRGYVPFKVTGPTE